MAIKEYWNFANEASVPAVFTEVEGGNGAVSINSDHLRIDTGGASLGDYAAVVYGTALDQSKFYVIYGECKFSGETSAWLSNMVGLINSSGEPGAMTTANRNAAMRIWHEYQVSTGADEFDRIIAKQKNSSDTQYTYDPVTGAWTSGFTARGYFDIGSYYRFVVVYDGTTSPARARLLVYGYTEGSLHKGWGLNYDSAWSNFDTGAAEIDPVDDDLWVFFGDLRNDATPTNQTIFDFRRIMIAEIDTSNLDEIGFTNYRTETGKREIQKYFNPMPNDQTLWIPHESYDWGTPRDTPAISRGADDFVKDPYCFFDGTTYWLFYQRDNAGEGEINVSSTTDILNGSWGSETVISQPVAGETYHMSPWVTKYGGTWYMFYGVQKTAGPAWEIQYKTTTQTNPTSGWSSATTLFDPSGSTYFDDEGANTPSLVWHSGTFTGGTWYLLYSGVVAASGFEGGIAKSTTGILGTYTKVQNDAMFPVQTFSTLLSGAHTDAAQCTVDSTTGLTAGMFIYISDGEDASMPYEVLSVDDGTTFTPHIEVTEVDNAPVRAMSYHAVGPGHARYIGGYWFVYCTVARFADFDEAQSIYVDITGEIALEDCSFREMRVGDSPIDFVIPPVAVVGNPAASNRSDENLRSVVEALTGPVAFYTSPKPAFRRP